MAKDAEERYQSAEGLRADLEQCLAQWLSDRAHGALPLGRAGRPERLPAAPAALRPRARSWRRCSAAFERVARERRPELVLVSGYSGIGKSALVNELHQPIARRRGFFLCGKFDQFQRDVPYATLAQAFRSWCSSCSPSSDGELAALARAPAGGLGGNGQVLVDVVPAGGAGDRPAAAGAAAAARRRRRTASAWSSSASSASSPRPSTRWCSSWTICSGRTRPASSCSQYLLATRATRCLLLMGAYRDNEVTAPTRWR